MSELSPAIRGIVEGNIDTIVENPESFASILGMSEIEPTDDTLTAFALGLVLSVAHTTIGQLEKEEMGEEEMKELLKIMRRRRMDIIDAIRGYLE